MRTVAPRFASAALWVSRCPVFLPWGYDAPPREDRSGSTRLHPGVRGSLQCFPPDCYGTLFSELFWNLSTGCLNDVVNSEVCDPAVCPNQIFAVSLFHIMLPQENARSVVNVVERKLLTPYGFAQSGAR